MKISFHARRVYRVTFNISRPAVFRRRLSANRLMQLFFTAIKRRRRGKIFV
jgi:hypothetical protein